MGQEIMGAGLACITGFQKQLSDGGRRAPDSLAHGPHLDIAIQVHIRVTPGGAGARWMPSREAVRWMGGGGALTPDSRRSIGTRGACCSSSSRGRYDTCT